MLFTITFHHYSYFIPLYLLSLHFLSCNIFFKMNTFLLVKTRPSHPLVHTKCSEAYFKLRNISRLQYCLDTPMRIMLVRNLILLKLDYCNAILANIPKYLINKLQRVMNASVRFIYDIKKHDHISYYLKKAHFLPVKKRIEFKLCTLVFKITHNLAPTYLKDLVKLHIPTRDLRVGRDSFMVESRKQSKTISNKMAEVWNKLPKHIRSANDITTFKKMLKITYYGRIQ